MTWVKPRQTVYKGVTMRSRLEAGYAMWLDQQGIEWEYEPQAFGDETGQYLPDFRVTVRDQRRGGAHIPGYIEVKPRCPDPGDLLDVIRSQTQSDQTTHLEMLGRKLAVIRQSDPTAALLLVWPGLQDRGHLVVLRLWPLADRPGSSVFLPAPVLKSFQGGFLALGDPMWPHEGPWPDQYWQVD